jgi:hypothetical protein
MLEKLASARVRKRAIKGKASLLPFSAVGNLLYNSLPKGFTEAGAIHITGNGSLESFRLRSSWLPLARTTNHAAAGCRRLITKMNVLRVNLTGHDYLWRRESCFLTSAHYRKRISNRNWAGFIFALDFLLVGVFHVVARPPTFFALC